MEKDFDKRELWIEDIESHTGIYADWSSLEDKELEDLRDYVISHYQENKDW